MKKSVSMFHTPDARMHYVKRRPPPDAKTQVRCNLSQRAFYAIRTGPTRAWIIVQQCFVPRMHRNALRDPQIPPDGKTQVRCNLSRCAFYGKRTVPTREWKIVHRYFTPGRTRMHYVTRWSYQMQKHKFDVTCSSTPFMETAPGPPENANSALTFHAPETPECTGWLADPTGRKNISSA
jgi:hypothetical protein